MISVPRRAKKKFSRAKAAAPVRKKSGLFVNDPNSTALTMAAVDAALFSATPARVPRSASKGPGPRSASKARSTSKSRDFKTMLSVAPAKCLPRNYKGAPLEGLHYGNILIKVIKLRGSIFSKIVRACYRDCWRATFSNYDKKTGTFSSEGNCSPSFCAGSFISAPADRFPGFPVVTGFREVNEPLLGT